MPRASVVLLTAAHVRTGEEPDAPAYSDYALHDVGQAAAHLTLQARAMGLHAHQFAGFDHDALAEALGVPATHDLLTGIAIGLAGDPGGRRRAHRGTRSPRPRAQAARRVGVHREVRRARRVISGSCTSARLMPSWIASTSSSKWVSQ